jgi:hypothetical protein
MTTPAQESLITGVMRLLKAEPVEAAWRGVPGALASADMTSSDIDVLAFAGDTTTAKYTHGFAVQNTSQGDTVTMPQQPF